MPRFNRNRILLAKIQPTVNTDAVPTGAANAILLAADPQITPFSSNNVDRDLVRGYFGTSEQLVGTGYVGLSFKTELQSSGTPGTAPAWGPLARGAAWAEVILAAAVVGTAVAGSTVNTINLAAGASAVDDFYNGAYVSITGGTGNGQAALIIDYVGATKIATIAPAWTVTPDVTSGYSIAANVSYNPISSSVEMLSMYYYRDGLLRKAINCRGNMESIECPVGGRPVINWKFLGIDAGVSASANPAATLTGWKVPQMITDVNTGDVMLGGIVYPSRGFTLAGGNKVDFTPLLGGETIDITDRDMTGKIELDLTAAQVATFHTAVRANTLYPFGFVHGTAAGSRIAIQGPQVQLLDQSETDNNGRALDVYAMRCLPFLGNDECRLVAM